VARPPALGFAALTLCYAAPTVVTPA